MTGQRILWLARMLPVPADAGDRIYTARLVESLADAGATIDYVGLANPERPDLMPAAHAKITWRAVAGRPRHRVRALLSREPVVGGAFGTSEYRRQLALLLAQKHYDAIVLDQYGLAWTLPILRRHYRDVGLPPIIHVAHDFETEVTQAIARDYRGNPLVRALLRRNAGKTADAERRIATACDLVVALTQHDIDMFRSINAKMDGIVIPPGYSGPRLARRVLTAAVGRGVVILGSYRWIAKQMNLAAFLEVADAMLHAAGIEVIVIGDVDPAFRDRWQPRVRATRFLGFVDDIEATLADTRMGLVIEATGGGFKLKVLDYVFMRQPVAALAPALGGQSEAVTRHFLVEDDARALATAIIARIDDIDALNAMQNAAYQAALPLFDWQRNGVRLAEAIASVSARHAAAKASIDLVTHPA